MELGGLWLLLMLVLPGYMMLAFLMASHLNLSWQVLEIGLNHQAKNAKGNGNRTATRGHRAKRSIFENLNTVNADSPLLEEFIIEPCGGAVYTRWGRRTCPEHSDSDTVYDGVVGGTNTDSFGGGVDYLCLPHFPQWATYTFSASKTEVNQDNQNSNPPTDQPETSTGVTAPASTTQSEFQPRLRNARSRPAPNANYVRQSAANTGMNSLLGMINNRNSWLYGAEFRGGEPLFRRDNLHSDTFVNQDVVCAVCRVKSRPSQVMLPGRRECMSGWTKEYEGYLMTGPMGSRSQHRFVCVDSLPEVDFKGYRRDGGAVFHHVRAMCGSLPCPMYVQGRELTCVVCTK